MQFTKMHGAGNDYVYVDCFRQDVPANLPELARAISDRRFGVGGDGLILIRPAQSADARMQMFNSDGSESEMCGNGLRCVAKYLYDHRLVVKPQMTIETGAGNLEVEIHANGDIATAVTVDMGRPILEGPKIPTLLSKQRVIDHPLQIDDLSLRVTCVSMGNPHCVCFVDSITDDHVLRLGPRIETDARFPRRTNVEFVEILSRREVRQRTWERGSGETWACGTGAAAVCVAGVLTGRTDREVLVHLLGGDLRLRWESDDASVFMTGPAVEVFSGVWPAEKPAATPEAVPDHV